MAPKNRTRKANERIVDILNYLDIPTASKEPDRGDPWYFGWKEDQWRRSQDNLHGRIQSGNGNMESINGVLSGQFKMSKDEIEKYIDWSSDPRNAISRSVYYGTPHAQTGEILAQKVLQASGIDARQFNQGSVFNTDLEMMVGNLNRLIDVQYRVNRGGANEIMGIGALQKLRQNTGLRSWYGATDSDTLESIINRTRDQNRGNRYMQYDKLLHTRDHLRANDGQIKDYIITGRIDRNRVNNLTGKPNHGNWDPTAPRDMIIYNNQRLHDEMLGMTKRQLIDRNVSLMTDEPTKLKFNVPFNLVKELALERNMIDPEIVRALNQY